MFPNGDKDIDAATKECRLIFDNSISYEVAKDIFLKTTLLNNAADNYTEEMLLSYFQREIKINFNSKQIKQFFGYLTVVKVANSMHNAGPSEIRRNESGYYW